MKIENVDGAGEGAEEVVDLEVSQESVAAELNQENEDGSGSGTGEGVSGDEGGGGSDIELPIDQEILGVYKEFIGEDIPDDFFNGDDGKVLSKTAAIKKLNSVVSYVAEKNAISDDPFISNYVNAKSKEGFNKDDYIKSITSMEGLKNLSSKDFLRKYYKEKGQSESDVEEFIKSHTKIGLDELAAKGRLEIEETQSLQLEKSFNESFNSKKQELEVSNQSTEVAIDDQVNNVLLAGKHPLKFAESEIKVVSETMKDLTKRVLVKGESGVVETSKLFQFLSDDSKLLKVLPYIALEELGMLDQHSRETLNRVKDNEFDKIEGSNSFGSGGSSEGKQNWGKFFGQ